MKHRSPSLVLGLLLLASCTKKEQSNLEATSTPSSGLFADHAPLEISITAPIFQLIYQRNESIFDPEKLTFEPETLPATVTVQNQNLSAQIQTRGGIRFCDSFPHFKLKVDESAAAGTLFAQTKTLKMVTNGYYAVDPEAIDSSTCDNSFTDWNPEANYRREFFIYRMAQGIFPVALAVRSAQVQYIDPAAPLDIKSWAFFIENMKTLAARHNAKEKEFSTLDENMSWLALEGQVSDDTKESLLGYYAALELKKRYEAVAAENPKLSPKEISAQLPTFADLMAQSAGSIEGQRDAALPDLQTRFKTDQLNFLKSMDKATLVQIIWFNVMIGNTDWDIFGINGRDDVGFRNVKFIQSRNDNRITPVPYDFDGASMAGLYPANQALMTTRLHEAQATLATKFPFVLENLDWVALKTQFSERVRALLIEIDGYDLGDQDKTRMKEYLSAFLGALNAD